MSEHEPANAIYHWKTVLRSSLYGMSVAEQESVLDEWIKQGHCIVVRGSERNYDTIIDHVMFRFVTDPIYDTPVDSSKHPEYTE